MSTTPQPKRHQEKWRIRIHDGFCEFEYNLSSNADACIHDLYEIIRKRLSANATEGKRINTAGSIPVQPKPKMEKQYPKRPDLYDENAGMEAYRRKLMGLPRDPLLWDQESEVEPPLVKVLADALESLINELGAFKGDLGVAFAISKARAAIAAWKKNNQSTNNKTP